jgi:RNA polymerase sigma-70 factor (ECF subfamily)
MGDCHQLSHVLSLGTPRRHDAVGGGNRKMADFTSQGYESELVEKLRSGDSAAKEELYNTYKDRLHSLVFERVGRNQAVVEDLVQEVFLAALSSLDKFRGDSRLHTWLCSIAYHKIGDFYRRQAREAKPGELPSSIDAMDPKRIWDTEPTPLTVIESEGTRHAVRQALVDLPMDYQQVLALKYIEDMPVQEISQVMGRSPKSVEGLLTRARKALRVTLTEADQSD